MARRPSSWALFLTRLLSCVSVASCYPQVQDQFRHRSIDARQIQDSYDYVVIGGGQSGLVVANRLSEDPNVRVLIVEYGTFDDSSVLLQPQSAVAYPRKDLFNLTSTPQPGLDGSPQVIYSASVVGGGSAVNGMFLNRGAADDYNNWERLGNEGWGWDGILPYFVKSSTFDAPSPQLAQEFNITWNESAYGDGPIHLSMGQWHWPGTKLQIQGLVEMGIERQLDGADGHGYGVFWVTNAIDNATVTRSYSRNGYYDPVKDRPNLQILTFWRVNEVLFDDNKHATSIIMQPRGSAEDSDKTMIKATKEIILAAGSLHSPQILQRSGIGPSALLKEAGIDVLVDLPGVGGNLQDHPPAHATFKYTTNILPNPDASLANATFMQWAQAEWANHRSGPFSIGVGNTAGLIPLSQVSPDDWQSIAADYLAQNAADVLPSVYLPEQVKGYEAQRRILADSLARNDAAVMEYSFSGGGSPVLILTKPFSRGTVLLDPADKYADPILDYNTLVNPADARIMAESYRFARRHHETESMRALGPVESTPGPALTALEDLVAAARKGTTPTAGHLSGTCAMMPRELGGVVAPDLTVYGVTGLSVADSSVQPLIPGTHICATVYAVAEKAADLIKARHG